MAYRSKAELEPHSDRERTILRDAITQLRHPALRPGDIEQVVAFWAASYGDVVLPRSEITWRDYDDGSLTFQVRLTSATDFDKLHALGWVAPAFASLRSRFRDAHKVHAVWPDSARVVAVLAAFYLSRSGGGERDRQGAWDLLNRYLPDLAVEPMTEYHALLRQLRRDFGALTSREQAA